MLATIRDDTWNVLNILEVGVSSHAQISHIVLGCLASFSLFIKLTYWLGNAEFH